MPYLILQSDCTISTNEQVHKHLLPHRSSGRSTFSDNPDVTPGRLATPIFTLVSLPIKIKEWHIVKRPFVPPYWTLARNSAHIHGTLPGWPTFTSTRQRSTLPTRLSHPESFSTGNARHETEHFNSSFRKET